jgi:hypothetical protein
VAMVVSGKLQYYIEMEALYRKQADTEPDNREKHLASADAWRRLSDTASLFSAKQSETREVLASITKQKGDGGLSRLLTR